MQNQSFPHSTETVVTTLAELLKLQRRNSSLVEILETAQARIEETSYDGWDDGTYLYTLFLDVPLKLYAKIEPEAEGMEKTISLKLKSILKDTANHLLHNVVIGPILQQVVPRAARQKVAEVDVEHLWDAGYFRLFLCHVANHKVAVSSLKQHLQVFGVSCFIAHEDIKPSLEWQREIELALGSMHALVALLTPKFGHSDWTDQEVGVALGRGLLVIPARLGLDPYGFIGKHQALTGDLNSPEKLASGVVEILTKHKSTFELMKGPLVTALERAPSFATATAITAFLELFHYFTSDQIHRIEVSLGENRQVRDSSGVPARLQEIIHKHGGDAGSDVPF